MSQNAHRWTHFPSFDSSWKGLNGSLTLNKTESPIHEFYHWSFRVHFYISQIGFAKRCFSDHFYSVVSLQIGIQSDPRLSLAKIHGYHLLMGTHLKFNSWPLKSYRNLKGKESSNHHFFRGELLNFGGVTFGICLNLVVNFCHR